MDRRPPSPARALVVGLLLVSAVAWAARPARRPAIASHVAASAVGAAAIAQRRDRSIPRLRAEADALPVATTAPPLPDCPAEVAPALPDGVERLLGIEYGRDPRQRFDVYYPAVPSPTPRPVLVIVHGGGWRDGDKLVDNVWRNKVAWWVPRGWIVLSVNYRMLPDTPPLEQAGDVAAAVARAQQLAPALGGDPRRFVLMGHSAGAHLVALLDADTTLAATRGVQPWRATVALDSAAYDVPRLMRAPHLPLYDDAFGTDSALWPVASPLDRLQPGGAPLLGVCSSQRLDSCPQARDFATAARTAGTPMTVSPQDLSHEQINETLGLPGPYTELVDRFIVDAVR
ncbi:alpha/beta hydrolase [Lysobacter xanthus]